MTNIALARNPIIVSQRKTRGWNDLIMYVVGGGIQPGYYTVLHFDGRTYPDNATVDPAAPLKTRAKGVAYLVGEASYETGIVLRSR